MNRNSWAKNSRSPFARSRWRLVLVRWMIKANAGDDVRRL